METPLLLKHTVYPSPLVYTEHGKARFSDFHFETPDKKLGNALRKSPDIVEVKKARGPEDASGQAEEG